MLNSCEFPVSILRHRSISGVACGNHLREGQGGTFGCEGAEPRARAQPTAPVKWGLPARHGGTPIAGCFLLGKIPLQSGGWLAPRPSFQFHGSEPRLQHDTTQGLQSTNMRSTSSHFQSLDCHFAVGSWDGLCTHGHTRLWTKNAIPRMTKTGKTRGQIWAPGVPVKTMQLRSFLVVLWGKI